MQTEEKCSPDHAHVVKRLRSPARMDACIQTCIPSHLSVVSYQQPDIQTTWAAVPEASLYSTLTNQSVQMPYKESCMHMQVSMLRDICGTMLELKSMNIQHPLRAES